MPDSVRSEELLGDWEREICAGFVSARIYPENSTPAQRRSPKFEPESLEILVCEPWAVDSKTKEPTCPLWVFRDMAAARGCPPVDTSWETVKKLPWKEVTALPLATYHKFYEKDYTNKRMSSILDQDFMGSGLRAIVRLDLQKSNNNKPSLVQVQPYAQLHYTCEVESQLERRNGVKLPKEALDRVKLSMERAHLRKLRLCKATTVEASWSN